MIKDWLPEVEIKIHIPCFHCLCRNVPKPLTWDIKILEGCVISGKYFVNCDNVSISIESLAPELMIHRIFKSFFFLDFFLDFFFFFNFKNVKKIKKVDTNMIDYEKLEIEKEIGEGGFARVHLGKLNGEKVAVKVLRFFKDKKYENEEKETQYKEFRKEVQLMSGLEHPNLVQLKGVCQNPFCMILEYMDSGNLFDFLHTLPSPFSSPSSSPSFSSLSSSSLSSPSSLPPPLPPSLQLSFSLDISKGMNFLHSATPEIIHRDLKSPNILVFQF